MKHTKKYIALTLAMALGCLAVLTACSGNKSTSTSQSTGTSASQAASGSTEETAAQETVMGEVTYVGSNYISVTVYTGGEEATDFTTLDVSGLTASEDTDSIDTTDATEYFKAEAGTLNAATRDDVSTGTFIVSTWDEEGNHQIILIEVDTSADDSTVSGSDAAEGTEGDTTEEDTAASYSLEEDEGSDATEA